MRTILEELKPQLFRQSDTGGKGSGISRFLSETGKIEEPEQLKRITSQIDKFFGEKPSGFTYEKFKNLIRPKSLSSKKDATSPHVFGIGSEERSKVKKFANIIELKNKEGDSKSYYDEYVETFFMYFYYQLFVKLFDKVDVIIKKNEGSIKNAKQIISKVEESLKADTEENLGNLYRTFYSTFAGSMANPKELFSGNEIEMVKYFESFANQNVEMFIDYPLSTYVRGSGTMKIEDFIDELFDSMESLESARTSNRQLASINLLSDFIKGNEVEFDVVALQEKIPAGSQKGNKIKFPTKVEAIINDTIEELASMDDISEIGMSWAKGTKWEPYIRLVCAIISLEGISESVRSISKKMKGTAGTYRRLIDEAEADGGLYFINARAFSSALSETKELSNMVNDLNKAIEEMSRKTIVVQNTEGTNLIEMLFEQYSDDLMATDSESMNESQRDSIVKIMRITGLMEELAGKGTMANAVQQINKSLFRPENDPPKNLKPRNEEAVEDAMINVGDVVLNEVRKDSMSSYWPSDAWQGIKDIASSSAAAFEKIFDTTFSANANDKSTIDNIISAFNDEFSSKFDFLTMERDKTNPEKFKIVNKRKGRSSSYSIDFNNIDEFKKYVRKMCSSIPSIMYHSKVCFAPNQSKEEKYKKYFNMLSWFVQALEKQGKSTATAGGDYPVEYLITPFFLETVKYSLRAFINDAHNIIEIDEKLKKQIKESREKASMEEDEWKPIVEQFSKEIEKYLKLKA
jgi:flagellin-specific chaperone FliS